MTTWHRSIAAAIVLATIALGSVPALAASAPAPWLQDGFNAANSNANTAEHTITPTNAAQVRTVHTLTVAGDNQCDAQAGVAVSDDYTYAVDGTTLSKFSTTTGARVWTVPTNSIDEDYYDIAISHGLAIVGGNECGTTDPNGDITAFRTTDGKQIWSVDADEDGLSAMGVTGKYLVAYTRAGLESDPQFHVFDVQSGAEVWLTSLSDAAELCDIQVGVVAGELFQEYCPNGDGTRERLQALDVTDGRVLWSKDGVHTVIRGDSDTSAAHHLYVNDAAGHVLDLNPKNGATRFALSGATVFAVDATRAYGPCGTGYVCGYAVADGHRLWRAADLASAESAIVGGQVLYLGDGLVLDAVTGRRLTVYSAGPSVVGSGQLAVVSGDVVQLQAP